MSTNIRNSNQKRKIETTFVSYYPDIYSSYSDRKRSIKEFIEETKTGGSHKQIITKIRRTTDLALQSELKIKLPAYTFTGIFGTRKKNGLRKSSTLAILDFDNKKIVKLIKEHLSLSEYCLAFWLSPRLGYKALFIIPEVNSDEEYKEYYQGLLREFGYLEPDTQTSDISRLCFVSYDPDIYVNYDAIEFNTKVVREVVEFNPRRLNSAIAYSEAKKVDIIYKWWRKKYKFDEGNRNNAVFVLACSLCEFGVSKTITQGLVSVVASSSFNTGEINRTIESAYRSANFNSKSFDS